MDPSPATRAALRRRLLAWYDAGHRDLPWRAPQGQAEPYGAWLAEVMLQQTRVEAVIPYWHRFRARFPDLPALAAAGEEEVLALWAGLGYYARGRNLLQAARAALARHGGLPSTLPALRALPGFGPYTAGAVASIAFGVRAAAVDGNAARVLARIFLLAGRPEEPAVRRRLWALAEALLPEDRPGDLNQALMELGATACGRRPACHRCPVEGLCRARREGREAAIPPPRRRAAVRELVLACAVVEREGRWLLARRPSRGLLGGLWELPSAVLRAGEPAAPALRRALRQEHGIAARVGRPCGQVERLLTHRRLRLLAYRCTAEVGEEPGERLRFAAPAELWRLGSSTALRRLAEAVMADAAAPHRAPAPKSAGSRRAALGKRPAFH